MTTVFNKKENCCGCTACRHICPTKSISMKEDNEGFYYPEIDKDSCIECGLCRQVCTFQNGYDKSNNLDIPIVYAAKHIDESIRMTSTSGGAFTAISDIIIDNGGVVYGVGFDENMNVVHQKAVNKKERDRFKGSKYVQSDLKDCFAEIKNLLDNGKNVLFSGTPCQVAGLKGYLVKTNTSTSNLLLCDIVCHGVPSPLMWREHIKSLERKEKSKIEAYYFRSKVRGWHGHNELVKYNNGKIDFESIFSQKHKNLFYSHNILRPSCHECKYTNLQRPSDITIADFWGIEKHMVDFDDNKGVSLILLNTKKGKNYFEYVKEVLIYKKSSVEECLQPQLQHPSKPSNTRNKFWNDYKSKGYGYVIKKYGGYNLKTQIKKIVKSTLSKLGILKYVLRFRTNGN